MDTFYSLNKLLSTLPFSILGYYEHEKELDDFFERLCESDFISKKSNIELVSYSYAKLENLNEWETKSLSSKFFFHALNEKYSLLALNVYYSIRNKLFNRNQDDVEKSRHLSNNVAIVLSRLFLKDVGFRLSYTKDKDWYFGFLEQNRIFSIRIPLDRLINVPKDSPLSAMEIFRNALGKFLADSVVVLKSENSLQHLLIQKIESRNSSYQKVSVTTTPIDSQFGEFIKVFNPLKELKELRNEFIKAIMFWHRTNPRYFNPFGTVKHVLNWSELFFQIAFISLVYDSWIEYFPAVCGLDEKDGRKYRNLGGLILGYRIDENNSFTQEERSIVRIISSRISSTVAGQYIHEINEHLQFELKRRQQIEILKDFHEKCLMLSSKAVNEKKRTDVIDHAANPVTQAHVFALSEFNILYQDKFSKCGLILFKNRVEEHFKENEYVDMDFFVTCHHEITNVTLKAKCNFISKANTTLGLKISEDKRPYINISLAHYFITEILQRGDAIVVTLTKDNQVIIHVDYKDVFNVSGLLSSLQNTKSGKLSTFIKEHYSDFRIAGNLLVYDNYSFLKSNGSTVPLLNLEKQFRKKSNGSLLFSGLPPAITESNKITFIIEYYSI